MTLNKVSGGDSSGWWSWWKCLLLYYCYCRRLVPLKCPWIVSFQWCYQLCTNKTAGCRRMEDAVKAIPESSELCKKIVLGHNVDDIPGKCLLSVLWCVLWVTVTARCYAERGICYGNSVHLSVSLSVTRILCIKMAEHIIEILSLSVFLFKWDECRTVAQQQLSFLFYVV